MWSNVLELEAIPPFDFYSTMTQFGVHPPLEIFEKGVYHCSLRLSTRAITRIAVKSIGKIDEPMIEVKVSAAQPLNFCEEGELIKDITWRFGLGEDLSEFYVLTEQDPLLHSTRENLFGMKLHARDLFYSISLAIALQNAPLSRSREMLRLLTERFGEKAPNGGLEIYTFPIPDAVARATLAELKECKWGYRAGYLINSAKAVVEGTINTEILFRLPTPKALDLLMKVKGIGGYSAEITMLEAFRRYDLFPIDSWSRRIFSSIYFEGVEVSMRELKSFAEKKWGPYRGLAFIYILNDLENVLKRSKNR